MGHSIRSFSRHSMFVTSSLCFAVHFAVQYTKIMCTVHIMYVVLVHIILYMWSLVWTEYPLNQTFFIQMSETSKRAKRIHFLITTEGNTKASWIGHRCWTEYASEQVMHIDAAFIGHTGQKITIPLTLSFCYSDNEDFSYCPNCIIFCIVPQYVPSWGKIKLYLFVVNQYRRPRRRDQQNIATCSRLSSRWSHWVSHIFWFLVVGDTASSPPRIGRSAVAAATGLVLGVCVCVHVSACVCLGHGR